MFSAGGGVRRLRLRLVPVHIPLDHRKVVVHLIHGQQGHLRSDAKAPKVNHNTPGCGGRKGARPDLEIPINQPVGFKVIVVFAEWIYQLFGHLRGKKTQHRGSQRHNRPRQQPVQVISITFSHPT